MRYKNYRLEKWCKAAKIRMIENDLQINDVCEGTGLTRSYVIAVLNGRVKSPTARDKISYFLKINNYYNEDSCLP